jgi:hypothetical protein
MKKILSALVALAFLASAVPTFAADPANATTTEKAAKPKKKATKKSAKAKTAPKKAPKDEGAPPPATK